MQKPLSPHLQIYTPQLTSVLSILHRITGLAFISALFLVCAWLYALSSGEKIYANFCDWITHPFGKAILSLMLASVYYHLLNGIRYLIWSLGKGFELKIVYCTGWIICFLTLALTIFSMLLI